MRDVRARPGASGWSQPHVGAREHAFGEDRGAGAQRRASMAPARALASTAHRCSRKTEPAWSTAPRAAIASSPASRKAI
jgi:hypothetical protein